MLTALRAPPRQVATWRAAAQQVGVAPPVVTQQVVTGSMGLLQVCVPLASRVAAPPLAVMSQVTTRSMGLLQVSVRPAVHQAAVTQVVARRVPAAHLTGEVPAAPV
jgi:hypothetical protein